MTTILSAMFGGFVGAILGVIWLAWWVAQHFRQEGRP